MPQVHVYLRDEPVRLRMERTSDEGLRPEGAEDLVPVAFFANENDRPSFRAMLPPATVRTLAELLRQPVRLAVLAAEPASPEEELQAMVGLALPGRAMAEERAPWETDPDAWKRGAAEEGDAEAEALSVLAFAPLVRLERKFPHDLGQELMDLLECALAGSTRPVLEARVEKFLSEL